MLTETLAHSASAYKDGREVVIDKKGIICYTYPDKGTFNYANGNVFSSILWGKHKLFDMMTYDKLMSANGIQTVKKYNGFLALAGGA